MLGLRTEPANKVDTGATTDECMHDYYSGPIKGPAVQTRENSCEPKLPKEYRNPAPVHCCRPRYDYPSKPQTRRGMDVRPYQRGTGLPRRAVERG